MRLSLLFVLILGYSTSQAQTSSDSIYVSKSFLGYRFYQKDVRLNFNQLPYIMEDHQEAYNLISKARSNNTISSIISGTGGFLMGWQLFTAVLGGDPNWTLAGIGGGLIIISIPIFSKSYRQSLKAVDVYNAKLATLSKRYYLDFGLCSGGAGIILGF